MPGGMKTGTADGPRSPIILYQAKLHGAMIRTRRYGKGGIQDQAQDTETRGQCIEGIGGQTSGGTAEGGGTSQFRQRKEKS